VILNVTRGDLVTFDLEVTAEGGDTVTFTAKRRLLDEDADAAISKVLEPSDDATTLTLLPEDTAELADGLRLYWDVQVDDGAGGITTPLNGILVIAADVTLTASETS
jgi:hypothetical protein